MPAEDRQSANGTFMDERLLLPASAGLPRLPPASGRWTQVSLHPRFPAGLQPACSEAERVGQLDPQSLVVQSVGVLIESPLFIARK